MGIKISVHNIVKYLYYLIVFFTLSSLVSQIYKFEFHDGEKTYLTTMLNLDMEMNFPTLYQTLTMFFCSLMLFFISHSKKTINDKYHKQWFILGFLFFYMGTDEILMLHEQLNAPVRSALHTEHIIFFAWVIPAIIVMIIFFISYVGFLKNLSNKFRNLFLASATIYSFGAICMEIIGSRIVIDYGQYNLFYSLVTTVEEVCEMIGILLFIYTLLSYIRIHINNFNIEVVEKFR